MNRHRAREQALQTLYQMDLTNRWSKKAMVEFLNYFEVAEDDRPFTCKLVEGVLDNQTAIDALVSKHCDNWKLSRMAPVERNLLRMSTFELCFDNETAKNIVINEAIELAKSFADTKSPGFINGILDSIANSGEAKAC